MAEDFENILIRRRERKPVPDSPSFESQSSPRKKSRFAPAQIAIDFESKWSLSQMRALAIVVCLFSVLVFIAMISYSRADEANVDLTLRDFSGVIQGDELIRAKAERTLNWLGLTGAVIANALFNGTIGFCALIFPFFISNWALVLFRGRWFSRKLFDSVVVLGILSVLIAAFLGTLSHISFLPSMGKEWSGAVGHFVADVAVQLIGATGSLLVFVVAIVITLVLGTSLNFEPLFQWLASVKNSVRARALDVLSNSKFTIFKKSESSTGDSIEEIAVAGNDDLMGGGSREESEIDEPARFLRAVKKARAEPPLFPVEAVNANELSESTASPKLSAPTIIRPEKQGAGSGSGATGLGATKDTLQKPQSNSAPLDLKVVEEQREIMRGTQRGKSKLASEDDGGESTSVEDEDIDFSDDELGISKTITLTIEETVKREKDIAFKGSTLYDEDVKFVTPSDRLLQDSELETTVADDELKTNARLLQEKLEMFKITIENLTVTPGPVVTQYEFVPSAGIKISQIENLADDIALALKARGIRIIAPIPGRGTVGIEIPNHHPSLVSFKSIIRSPRFHQADHLLPLALGKTINGEVFVADLAKMPHLLIAGSTGSGKSVGVNTIISSLLYKKHPRDLKMVIIDPKKVEMTPYNALHKHFLAVSPDIEESIVTSPSNAVIVLKALVAEMEQRYDLLAAAGQRNILDYNRKVKEGKFIDTDDTRHRPLPYIVAIIDELADLMMTAGKEIEEPICRLAQMARAVGIHCIVATQRPSVDVITGLIKSNFPARISYLVASKTDSRTILDMNGAETLLGNGDMLFLPGGAPKPLRIQNSFITTDEVESICEHIGNQKGYSQPYMLPSVVDNKSADQSFDDDRDPLFADAARTVIRHNQGSVSLLQRRLKVGYSRAARIMDQLENAGVVGGFDGSKARAVLLESEMELEAVL